MKSKVDTEQFFDATVCDSDLMGYEAPHDIVEDPLLTVARKRQLLAYWASDIHAVPGAPAFRSYLMGPAVTIDQIQSALIALDEMVDLPAIPQRGNNTAAA